MLMIRRYHCAVSATLLLAGAAAFVGNAPPVQSDSKPVVISGDHYPIQGLNFRDESGAFSTFSTTGHVDLKNAFSRVSAQMAALARPAISQNSAGPSPRLR